MPLFVIDERPHKPARERLPRKRELCSRRSAQSGGIGGAGWKQRWFLDGDYKGQKDNVVRGIVTDDRVTIFT